MNELDTYLAHHGIKGQKWGVRRYQNPDGTLTAEGRKRNGLAPAKKESSVKKLVNEAKDRAAKKKQISEEEQHENLKNYVRKHPEKIYKYRDQFSDKEVNDLVSKIQVDRKLKDIRNEEIQRGWDKVNRISNNLGTLANLTNNSISTWNNSASIYNALVENKVIKSEKKMPKVNR